MDTMLAIRPQSVDAFCTLSRRAARREAFMHTDDENQTRPLFETISGIAVIPVRGFIVQRRNWLEEWGFATSCQTIDKAIHAAADDDGATGILLRIDSPGGTVAGMAALSDSIRRVNAVKPIWAFPDEGAYSGGYWIASQCGRIVLPETGGVGSLGVVQAFWDMSKLYSKEGIRVVRLRTGPYKGAGMPGLAITEEETAHWQRQIDALGDVFRAHLQRGRRDAKIDAVFTGEEFIGRNAISAGLADAMGSIDDVIDAMRSSTTTSGHRVQRAPRSKEVAAMGNRSKAKRRRGAASAVRGASGGAVGLMEPVDGPAAGPAGFLSPLAPMSGLASELEARSRVRAAVDDADEDDDTDDDAEDDDSEGLEDDDAAAAEDDDAEDDDADANATEDDGASEASRKALAKKVAREATRGAAGGTVSRKAAERMVERGVSRVLSEQHASTAQRRRQVEAIMMGAESVPGVKALSKKAMRGEISLQVFAGRVEAKVAAHEMPTASMPGVSVGSAGRDREIDDLSLALVMRGAPNIGRALDNKEMDPETHRRICATFGVNDGAQLRSKMSEIDKRYRNIGLRDVARKLHHGRDAASMDMEQVAAGSFSHGSSDFPVLTANVMNKFLAAGFAPVAQTCYQWCAVRSVTDFKAAKLVRISELGELKEVLEHEPTPETTFGELGEDIALAEHAREINISARLIINDDLDALASLPMKYGNMAARVAERLAYATLASGVSVAMSDGKTFFHADRNNIGSGVLSIAALKTAFTRMRSQKDFRNPDADIEIDPHALLVPIELEYDAKELMTWPYDPTASNANANVPNPVRGAAEPIGVRRLSRLSTTRWYVVASPTEAPAVTLAFLNGNRLPTVTQIGNGSARGMRVEILHRCGAALTTPEGAYTSPGT